MAIIRVWPRCFTQSMRRPCLKVLVKAQEGRSPGRQQAEEFAGFSDLQPIASVKLKEQGFLLTLLTRSSGWLQPRLQPWVSCRLQGSCSTFGPSSHILHCAKSPRGNALYPGCVCFNPLRRLWVWGKEHKFGKALGPDLSSATESLGGLGQAPVPYMAILCPLGLQYM